jgi:ABC-type polysaccharide/polyol phosphate export permease
MDRRDWDLIVQFALKDFKIRYTHSMLGYAWSVINPLLFSLIYFLVFSVFIRFQAPNYAGYLLLGVVMWNFFAEGSGNGVGSLLAHSGILSKVSMPRHVPVLAAILNALMTFLISVAVLAILLWLTGTPLYWTALAFPLDILNMVILTIGISLLLSPLHVRYHDVGYLWGLVVQIGFWLTPIIYVETVVPESWRWLVMYNPMARIVTESRQLVIYGVWPGLGTLLKTTFSTMLVFAAGVFTFRRLQARIVEHF